MVFHDNLKIAYKNISERKSRVFLTFLGISIGIMAIISLMAIGEGMENAVTGELSSLSDTIIITTGSVNTNPMGGGFTPPQDKNSYFTDRDLSDINRIDGIKSVNPVYFGMGIVEFNGQNETVSLLGINPTSMDSIFGIDYIGLEDGGFIREGDRNRCVIGYNVAHEYFDSDVRTDSMIKVNGEKISVSGIYQKQGAGMSLPTDDYIHLSPKDFERVTDKGNITGILVKVYDVEDAETISSKIESTINENHGDDEFTNAITMLSIIESIQNVLAIIQTVLIGIAAIALVVASIGIMNTMLTSVMERTHEIGVMKAIGARNSDIMVTFMMEGVLISMFGGFFGVVFGIIGANVFSALSSSNAMGSFIPIVAVINPNSIIIGMSVAVLVGLFSSLYPARKAALMSPIEAVRYE